MVHYIPKQIRPFFRRNDVVSHSGYGRHWVCPYWVAYAQRVFSQPRAAVVQPRIGVAPLLARPSVAVLGLSVGLTAATGDSMSRAARL